MNSDLILGAVIGGVLVLILWNKKGAAFPGGCGCGGGAMPIGATVYEPGGIAGPAALQSTLCDALTRY